MDKFLVGRKKTNKDKHGQTCYDQRRKFPPFVLSVEIMTGKEALVILATLIQLMAAKIDEPILHVTVNDVISDKNVFTKIMNNSTGLQRIELNGFSKRHWQTGYYPFVYGWCLGLC